MIGPGKIDAEEARQFCEESAFASLVEVIAVQSAYEAGYKSGHTDAYRRIRDGGSIGEPGKPETLVWDDRARNRALRERNKTPILSDHEPPPAPRLPDPARNRQPKSDEEMRLWDHEPPPPRPREPYWFEGDCEEEHGGPTLAMRIKRILQDRRNRRG